MILSLLRKRENTLVRSTRKVYKNIHPESGEWGAAFPSFLFLLCGNGGCHVIEFIAESEAGRQLKMWPIRVKSYETQRHEARLSPFSWLQYHTALNFDREHPSLSLSAPRSSLTLPLISGQCRVRLKARIAPRYRTACIRSRERNVCQVLYLVDPTYLYVFVFEPLRRVDENFLRRN